MTTIGSSTLPISATCVEVTDARWVDFVSNHPEATIFHHPAWSQLLTECYGYRPVVLAVKDPTGQIVAGLPLLTVKSWLTGCRTVSLPFSDFCPPLVAHSEALDELIERTQDWRVQHNQSKVEIRWPLPGRENVHSGEAVYRHVTPLAPDPQQVFRSLKRGTVKYIRQAERAGLSITQSRSWEDLKLFYGLLLRTRRRLGAPVQPLRFFHLLWEHLFCRDLGFVLLAYVDSRLLAGAVFLNWNRTVTGKYGASDPAAWHLRPNNMVFWHVIKWGCEQGYHSYDWGRTDPQNEGLRDFKRGWGSEEELLHYSILADQPPPTALQRSHGLLAPIIQRSPLWVCRTIGELLYGHFA